MSGRIFLHPAAIAMGAHAARARIRRALRGHERHAGSAVEILRAGLERCWTGRYLTASPGHYRQFWTRDTGFAAPALLRLGPPHPERLLASLGWAIDTWRRRRSHITTTIDPLLRWPVDIFDYGVDSLPLLLASLRGLVAAGGAAGAGAAAFAARHADWIATEVEHYVAHVVDPATGLVRSDRAYSAHRDTFRNGSTLYGNVMVAVLARTVVATGWGPDLLSRHFAAAGAAAGGAATGTTTEATTAAAATSSEPDWGSLLRRHFWLGDRFRHQLGSDETSGEANVWPFYAGLLEDPAMRAAALETIRREGYAAPYPLRFAVRHEPRGQLLAYRLLSPDYQTTAAWTSLGSIYLSLLREVDPGAAAVELARLGAAIERDGTFWEVLNDAGGGWRSRRRLSISDVSMLWGAILLETLEHPAGPPLRIA